MSGGHQMSLTLNILQILIYRLVTRDHNGFKGTCICGNRDMHQSSGCITLPTVQYLYVYQLQFILIYANRKRGPNSKSSLVVQPDYSKR